MTKLLDIIGLMEVSGDYNRRKHARQKAKEKFRKYIRPWNPDEFILGKIPLGYRELSMDYGNMEKLPEETERVFDLSGRYFGLFFKLDYNLDEIFKKVLLNKPNEELTSIVIGKRPEDLVYIAIVSGYKKMLGRIKALKGDEDINKPIYYGWIPYKEGSPMMEKYKGHIELLVPKNLIPKSNDVSPLENKLNPAE